MTLTPPRDWNTIKQLFFAALERPPEAREAFIAERDSFYLATVSENGWPYVQHRGGPPGFLRVLDALLDAGCYVGIATHDYGAALAFYQDTLGAKEAFTVRNDDGSVRLTYLQVSRDTFIELLPVAADQPAGIMHVGIETEDVVASVANLRARGIAVDDPTVGISKSRVARVRDPNGVQIEVIEKV